MKEDNEILQDVKAEIQWDSRLNGSEIKVNVKNGHVDLSGHVNAYSKKIDAEMAAMRVTGVTGIGNGITVKIGAKVKDTEIEKAVKNAIIWNSTIAETNIKILVEKGWVTLEGEVQWEYQRSKARNLAQDINGVTGVTNLINVISTFATSHEVKEKIDAALRRSHSLNADNIMVSVDGSKAILSGKVKNLAAKTAAEVAAWSAPGITHVENEITVEFGDAVSKPVNIPGLH
jgi:osmotically-inducible protein OsmY